MVGVCLGLPLTPWACRPGFKEGGGLQKMSSDRTFGGFNVVIVCTVLDVIVCILEEPEPRGRLVTQPLQAMLLMTVPGITLHQIYAAPCPCLS